MHVSSSKRKACERLSIRSRMWITCFFLSIEYDSCWSKCDKVEGSKECEEATFLPKAFWAQSAV